MKPHAKHYGIAVAVVLCVLTAGAAIFVYSGVYGIGADAPHTRLVFSIMQLLRERSIQARSNAIRVPPLDDPQLILKGAGQYAAMCTQCHLTPEKKESELRAGLGSEPRRSDDLEHGRIPAQAVRHDTGPIQGRGVQGAAGRRDGGHRYARARAALIAVALDEVEPRRLGRD